MYEKLKEEFDNDQVLPPSHTDIPYCGGNVYINIDCSSKGVFYFFDCV